MKMEQEMPNFNKQKKDAIPKQSNDREMKEGVYDVIDAFRLCNRQMQVRTEVIKKINNDEYCSDIMIGKDGIHDLCFGGMDREDVAGHIMHRVLVGTGIDAKEEREFIFDSVDVEIAELFQEILRSSNSEEIDDKIQQFRVQKGQVKTTRQFDN